MGRAGRHWEGGAVVSPKSSQLNLRVDAAVIPGEHPSPRRYAVGSAGSQHKMLV